MDHNEAPQSVQTVSRRAAIRAGLAGVALGVAGVLSLQELVGSQSSDRREPRTGSTYPMIDVPEHFGLQRIDAEDHLLNEDEQLAKTLRMKYGIEVYNGPLNDVGQEAISGFALDYADRVYFLTALQNVLAMYPDNFMQENGVRGIAFVSQLRHEGRRIGGINLSPLGIIQVDCDSQQPIVHFGAYVHHEIYHQCDYQENGFESEDRVWKAMHICDCQVYESDVSQAHLLDAPANWFVDDYSRRAPFEDRAKMAEWMMNPVKHRELLRLIETASGQQLQILVKKYDAILSDYFYFSNQAMNIQYWVDLLAEKIKPGYFS